MEKRLIVRVSPNGTIIYPAYCLRTDCWHDYQAFAEEAKTALAEDNFRRASRLLRASLASFFSHLEGVVRHIECEVDIPIIHSGSRLCDRTRNISQAAKRHGWVPHVDFRLGKHLRDLVAHPGIDINFTDREAATVLGQEDVFERLSIETLHALENKVVPWLDAVCKALKVERFTDTEAKARKFLELMGNPDDAETKEV